MWTKEDLIRFGELNKYKAMEFIQKVVDSHLEALALLAEKEKEIGRLGKMIEKLSQGKDVLRKVAFEQIAQRKYGIPFHGLSREQLIDVDGEFEQALAELEE